MPICFGFTPLKLMYRSHSKSVQTVGCMWMLHQATQRKLMWTVLFVIRCQKTAAVSLCSAPGDGQFSSTPFSEQHGDGTSRSLLPSGWGKNDDILYYQWYKPLPHPFLPSGDLEILAYASGDKTRSLPALCDSQNKQSRNGVDRCSCGLLDAQEGYFTLCSNNGHLSVSCDPA